MIPAIPTRVCRHCMKIKPIYEFRYDTRTGKPTNQCLDCRKLCQQNWLIKNPLFSVWENIKTRCYNPNADRYQYYGGRGIKVCERWLLSFKDFAKDTGERPTPKHQLDRINTNGDYAPENCEWVTPQENTQNRRSTKLTSKDVEEIRKNLDLGISQTELAALYQVTQSMISSIKTGRHWSTVTKETPCKKI